VRSGVFAAGMKSELALVNGIARLAEAWLTVTCSRQASKQSRHGELSPRGQRPFPYSEPRSTRDTQDALALYGTPRFGANFCEILQLFEFQN
jgi:hypothetical protein